MKRHLSVEIWIYTVLIMSMGLVALFSASFHNVRVPQKIFYDQLLCAVVGLLFMYFLGKIDYRRFYDAAYFFYGINVAMLMMVLLAGRHALGATRWLNVGGISFQPSELTKLAVILALGRYLSNRRPKLAFNWQTNAHYIWRDLVYPFLLTVVLMGLILKQPDLGTALLMLGICITMVFANGIDLRVLGTFLGIGMMLMPFAWHTLKAYQQDRLLVFLNPNIDPLGAGYTIIQSKIAIGSGQVFGKGWLGGTQNQLNFLPERHTDFIFSVMGEEWGFMGGLFMIVIYALLIRCGLDIAAQVKDKFGMLVTVGIVAILTLQVIINIGMVMGLFPIVGLTLPLVSYGRSSFMVFVVMMGFLLNLSKRRTVF